MFPFLSDDPWDHFSKSAYSDPINVVVFKLGSSINTLVAFLGVKYIFPFKASYKWNEDNFGPLYIPKAGTTIEIDTSNICLYERIITAYELNDLKIEGDKIYINGIETDSYTFQMNYYWLMGDNRHNSADARYWGFVPEDHIVGKAIFVWLSLDKDKSFPSNIRWKKMFRTVK